MFILKRGHRPGIDAGSRPNSFGVQADRASELLRAGLDIADHKTLAYPEDMQDEQFR
jgi:hypothetical protein